ncbi:MAG TPA: SGNH/GDSL hydrolase family protein [Gemmatimonadaceae bacterium]|nr:SGNH/GDSL hydrolase family protein [Gemmatimonadaceae bacterium]
MFTEYVALGDSMSIDLYPALDAGETDVAVALEWDARAGTVAPLGAAALLHQNADDRYAEFQGRDLATMYPGITYTNLAEDGATIGDVFGSQLASLPASDAPTLITLSAGGNDVLSAFANKPVASLLKRVVQDIGDAHDFLVEALRRGRPNALVVVTTVYDPSDGTRSIPGVLEGAGPLPLEALHELNVRIARLADEHRGVVVADVHRHFLGHGVTASEADRWYWRRSWIEPNAAGASEIRRVWLDAIDAAAEN